MSLASPARAADKVTLDQVYSAALKRSEVMASQAELIRQAEERYKQTLAARLPTISGSATQTQLDDSGSVPSNPSTQASQTTAKLSLNQPLFRGFAEFAAQRQGRALVSAQSEDERRAKMLLLEDVATNFYTVLSLEQDLANYDEELRQNLEREQDLQARVRIGRSRTSEVLNVQAAISSLRAQMQQLRGQLQVAREQFAFLSGMDPATPLVENGAAIDDVPPLEQYLATVEQRPDITAGQQRLTAAQEYVAVTRGARLPSVDLNGNYYLQRPGYLNNIKWDVQLSLTIPLYSGGGTQSRVREALSVRNQTEYELVRTRRLAEQELRSTHAAVTFDLAQLKALEKSTEAAARSYEAQKKEYRLGLVTNLDVLQALTALQQNRRALDRAGFATRLDYLKLQVAAGHHPLLQADVKP